MKICIYCKHSNYIREPYICKKHFIIHPVFGKQYIKCIHQNMKGNCQDYEESWIRKLINKLFK